MVKASPIAAEWLNQNSMRAYPFRENSGFRPDDTGGSIVEGGWTLPTYLVTDLSMSVSGANFSPVLYLKRVSAVGGTASLVFADAAGADVMAVHASSAEHYVNRAYRVAGTGSFAEARGVVCIGDLDRFLAETPPGAYSFGLSETQVEPTCIRPSAAGVRSISVEDASGYSASGLRGDVNLVAGANIRLDVDVASNTITISADPNSGYGDECDCDEASDAFVRSVNGVRTSDVRIVGDGCVNVETSDGRVSISDTCAQPCCGCAEVTFINNTINSLQTQVDATAGNVSALSARLSEFITNYLLSRKSLA